MVGVCVCGAAQYMTLLSTFACVLGLRAEWCADVCVSVCWGCVQSVVETCAQPHRGSEDGCIWFPHPFLSLIASAFSAHRWRREGEIDEQQRREGEQRSKGRVLRHAARHLPMPRNQMASHAAASTKAGPHASAPRFAGVLVPAKQVAARIACRVHPPGIFSSSWYFPHAAAQFGTRSLRISRHLSTVRRAHTRWQPPVSPGQQSIYTLRHGAHGLPNRPSWRSSGYARCKIKISGSRCTHSFRNSLPCPAQTTVRNQAIQSFVRCANDKASEMDSERCDSPRASICVRVPPRRQFCSLHAQIHLLTPPHTCITQGFCQPQCAECHFV